MAVTPGEGGERTAAPGRGVAFTVDLGRPLLYRTCRYLLDLLVRIWCRPSISGTDQVPEEGPVILAPVHRSFVDFAFTSPLTSRKLFFMAKDSLWESPRFGRLLQSLGCFPVHRQSADRQALSNAEEVLRQGQVLVLFPEGTRQRGERVHELLEGAAFLSARTGAPVVPVGIGNSDRVLQKGSKVPRPVRVRVVVGAPIDPPGRTGGGRVSRSRVHATTEELHGRLQAAYDEARRG